MPSILLDHHIDEAAMRATTYPDRRHRWSRRNTTTHAAAPAAADAFRMVRAAVGSALPDPVAKPIGFADVDVLPDPDWSLPSAAAARREAYAAADADYTALTPLAMALAPIIARLDDTPPPIDWADVLRGVEVRSGRDLNRLTDWATSDLGRADYWFYLSLGFAGLDELQGELFDELISVAGIYEDEAADMELLAVEAGLPIRDEMAVAA